MKEVLRLKNVSLAHGGTSSPLHGYNLEIYAGDVMVVSGLAGSGILGLLGLFSGRAAVSEGTIEICGQIAAGKRDGSRLWHSVYLCEDDSSQFDNLSVAENMALFSQEHRIIDYYSRRRVLQRASRYLRAADIDIDPDVRIDTLSQAERYQLTLLRAKMSHAALVVMDCTRELYLDRASVKLFTMIREFSTEGMAFLLIAFADDVFENIATRRQRMEYGRDRMEWRKEMWQNSLHHSLHLEQYRIESMTAIVDELIHNTDAQEYLAFLLKDHPDLLGPEVDAVPRKNEWFRDGIALIPRDSASRLLNNLSVAENLALAIPERVARSRFGHISKPMLHMVANRFYEETGVDPGKQRISQLSLVERKLLSVYRWEQAKPKLMILQEPFYGLDSAESTRLNIYLKQRCDEGLRAIMLTGTSRAAQMICGHTVELNRGKETRPAAGK